MDFFDKNGILLRIGDHIIPDEGRELTIVSIAYVDELNQWCMFGQQVLDPLAFSVLTQEDLSRQWRKLEVEN